MKEKKQRNGKQDFSRQENKNFFQKDMELELLIEDMGTEGEGIGKKEGVAFFVKDAVLGDLVRVNIMKMKKNYGYARLIRVLKPSPYFHPQKTVPVWNYGMAAGRIESSDDISIFIRSDGKLRLVSVVVRLFHPHCRMYYRQPFS